MQPDPQTARQLVSLRSQATHAMDLAHSVGQSITLGATRQERAARFAQYEDSLAYLQRCRDRVTELDARLRDDARAVAA